MKLAEILAMRNEIHGKVTIPACWWVISLSLSTTQPPVNSNQHRFGCRCWLLWRVWWLGMRHPGVACGRMWGTKFCTALLPGCWAKRDPPYSFSGSFWAWCWRYPPSSLPPFHHVGASTKGILAALCLGQRCTFPTDSWALSWLNVAGTPPLSSSSIPPPPVLFWYISFVTSGNNLWFRRKRRCGQAWKGITGDGKSTWPGWLLADGNLKPISVF
jgi:hypothetical protein